jgi:uncharacterized membrane protein YccC
VSNRGSAILYGVIVASALALLLLTLKEPSGRNLVIALAAGLVTAIVALVRLERS